VLRFTLRNITIVPGQVIALNSLPAGAQAYARQTGATAHTRKRCKPFPTSKKID